MQTRRRTQRREAVRPRSRIGVTGRKERMLTLLRTGRLEVVLLASVRWAGGSTTVSFLSWRWLSFRYLMFMYCLATLGCSSDPAPNSVEQHLHSPRASPAWRGDSAAGLHAGGGGRGPSACLRADRDARGGTGIV